ncbi:uncharacterized protein F4807DRAFT_410037 [Annulohypoxylon truncatum]|uniref:uncharacterized protein n=1 Tax=Annulohypoxylon truncatum TaxID=327061 RepID=UPI002008115A|nr:uncharacterized protein F4807DRAFT_410037 [Annulohypoxylon truncatum]KAI1213985.1 hypothetical protein F4807DRAFT_410037 [Annulohypoxylon truncatum]
MAGLYDDKTANAATFYGKSGQRSTVEQDSSLDAVRDSGRVSHNSNRSSRTAESEVSVASSNNMLQKLIRERERREYRQQFAHPGPAPPAPRPHYLPNPDPNPQPQHQPWPQLPPHHLYSPERPRLVYMDISQGYPIPVSNLPPNYRSNVAPVAYHPLFDLPPPRGHPMPPLFYTAPIAPAAHQNSYSSTPPRAPGASNIRRARANQDNKKPTAESK